MTSINPNQPLFGGCVYLSYSLFFIADILDVQDPYNDFVHNTVIPYAGDHKVNTPIRFSTSHIAKTQLTQLFFTKEKRDQVC